MPAAAVIGGASLIGGYKSSKAAKKAAQIQASMAQRGLEAQERQFERGRKDLAPYREVGEGAVYSLAQLYGIPTPGNPDAKAFGDEATRQFEQSPDYAFARDQGIKAIQFSNAAKGWLNSGNNIRDVVEFGSGLATQNFSNYAQRLMALAGLGGQAAATSSGQAANFGNAMANQYGNIGQAQASGIVGSANAWNSAFSNAANNALMLNVMNSQPYAGAYVGQTNVDPNLPWRN